MDSEKPEKDQSSPSNNPKGQPSSMDDLSNHPMGENPFLNNPANDPILPSFEPIEPIIPSFEPIEPIKDVPSGQSPLEPLPPNFYYVDLEKGKVEISNRDQESALKSNWTIKSLRCPYCQEEHEEKDVYCSNTGRELPMLIQCQECDQPNWDSSQFCINCAVSLNN